MFKLTFDIPPSEKKISISNSIYLLGSCFSDEIGARMQSSKLDVLANPFGTIYNPISLLKLLTTTYAPDDIIESQGLYYHWDAHGKIAGLSKLELLENVAEAHSKQKAFLQNCNWMILTFGSAMVYERQDVGVVANCHKRPGREFDKRFLTVSEIITAFEQAKTVVKRISPKTQFIFTVSPVRHLKDGLIENNRSKSILIEATHAIAAAHEDVSYFPSYEIVMDELRDYRFFKTDYAHPTEQAIDYVWEKFRKTYFTNDDLETLLQWDKVRKSLNHRPLHLHTPAHKHFLKQTLQQLDSLSGKLNLASEIEQLQEQLLAS